MAASRVTRQRRGELPDGRQASLEGTSTQRLLRQREILKYLPTSPGQQHRVRSRGFWAESMKSGSPSGLVTCPEKGLTLLGAGSPMRRRCSLLVALFRPSGFDPPTGAPPMSSSTGTTFPWCGLRVSWRVQRPLSASTTCECAVRSRSRRCGARRRASGTRSQRSRLKRRLGRRRGARITTRRLAPIHCG